MRININLENFRNRDNAGLVLKENNEAENIEPKRRRILREQKEIKLQIKKESSFLEIAKKSFIEFKEKFKDKFKMNEKQRKTPYVYYFLLGATIILALIGTALNISTYKELGKERYSVYNLKKDVIPQNSSSNKYKEDVSSISQGVELSKPVINNSQNLVLSDNNLNSKSKVNTKSQIKAPINTKYVFEYINPIKGAKVLKPFSIDNVVYSKTLDMWKIHEGIDFLADINTKVSAIEKGKIESIYRDSLYGVSVVLNHGNGYKSIYRNLDQAVIVKQGENVIKGQNIGLVGNTATSEIKDESHLHFEVIKNSDIVNPALIGIQ